MLFQCKNMNLVYDEDKEVQTYALKNINLSIEENKFIGIIGPSGSGKSSLLYCLAGLKVPNTGCVYYKDRSLNMFEPDEKASLRKKDFGFIFQKHFLIDYMTVMENVLTAVNDNSSESRNKALSLLRKLNIDQLANKMPYQLSGGQNQRAAIARAFMNDPKVIFADEPTASLDHSNANEVMNILADFKDKITIIVVTHDEAILQNADEIIHLWDGSIKAIDTRSYQL